jgi:dipeptidyl aminopeptidase/acylaminoacyl peptidase
MARHRRTLAATTGIVVAAASLILLQGPSQAAFPGNNGAIAYTCSFTDGSTVRTEICVGNVDGTNQRQLTTGPSFGNDRAAWSPDGTKLAFERRQSSQCCLTDLYVMQSNGNGLTQLTNTAGIAETGPAWSPDGTKIVYSRDDGQTVQLYVLTVATLASQPLAGTIGGSAPSWSPNGSKVAFSSVVDNHQFCEGTDCHTVAEIYTVSAAGGSPENLTEHNEAHDRFPNWAPSGNFIVFERLPHPRDGSGRVLMMEAGGEHDFEQVGDGNDPAFAPNGSAIAFDLNGSIFTALPATEPGSNETPLRGVHPDWQPCPPSGACPTTAASAQSPSTTTVAARRAGKKIKASGTLSPAHAGASMTVTLFKKKAGVFGPVKTVSRTLTSESKFAASFKRPGKGSCMVTAKFAGDSDHLASEASKNLKC